MPAQDRKLFQVRLTEDEKRGIKAMAASHGLTLRQAILRAFQAWAAQPQAQAADAAPGARAGAEMQKPGQPSRAAAPSDVSRRDKRGRSAAAKARSNSGQCEDAASASTAGQQAPSAPVPDWLRRAPQLDWSKCPAAECLRGEIGNIWVVRGTDAPLARVLQSVADGHPVAEVVEYFDITPLQLVTVLQFAAEAGAPAASAK